MKVYQRGNVLEVVTEPEYDPNPWVMWDELLEANLPERPYFVETDNRPYCLRTHCQEPECRYRHEED